VNIELKSYETADKVVDLIEHFIADKYWNYNQFIVSSFDWNALAGCLLNSAIRIGVLTEENLDLAWLRNLFSNAQFILITIY
jgi:glycerophosphoryl diester phosphodiesterase